jgi:beta-phosphoglucomutase-like phosphatase (HAD superfamily)
MNRSAPTRPPTGPFPGESLLFDVDGTLADSDNAMTDRVSRLLRPLRFLVNEARAAAFSRKLVMAAESPGNWLLELADRLSMDHLIARVLERRAARQSARVLPVIPGIPDMLAALQRAFLWRLSRRATI